MLHTHSVHPTPSMMSTNRCSPSKKWTLWHRATQSQTWNSFNDPWICVQYRRLFIPEIMFFQVASNLNKSWHLKTDNLKRRLQQRRINVYDPKFNKQPDTVQKKGRKKTTKTKIQPGLYKSQNTQLVTCKSPRASIREASRRGLKALIQRASGKQQVSHRRYIY